MLDSVLSALQGGDHAAAVAAARTWLVQEPDNAQARHLLGVGLQAQGQLDDADAAFAQAAALAPERAEFHIARALLAVQRRDTAAARAGLDHAIAQDPNQLVAYLSLAQLALAGNDMDEAERQLRLAERINPDHPHLLALRGQALHAKGQGDAALAALGQAVQQAPDDAMVQGVLGLALLSLGRFGFAEQALRNALALQPNPALRHALLRSLLAQNRVDEARDEVAALLRDTPNDAAALALQGQLALARGDRALARDAFERSLQARPHSGVLQALQRLLQDAGVGHDLAAIVETVVARHPGFDPGWAALLTLARGDGVRSSALAERWYIASPTVPATELLAQVSEAGGDHARAAELAQSVVARDPSRTSAQIVLARAALRAGDAAAAVARLQPLAAKTGDAATRRGLLGWLGMALDRNGQFAAAAAAWQEGQRLAQAPLSLPRGLANPVLVETALARAASIANVATQAGTGVTTLLWGAPGSSPEIAASLLRGASELHLASDRFSPRSRLDGFSQPEAIDLFPATLEGAADEFVASWHAGLSAAGVTPANAVDWLPHLDSRVLPMLRAAAPGTRIVVVLRDPRDLLLNWLAFGAPQRYGCADPVAAARWLAEVLGTVAMLREQALLPMLELGGGVADGKLSLGADALASFLELAQPPDTGPAQRLRNGPLALPTALPDNHWRHYGTALADAFAPLHAIAARLGYPAG